MNNAEAISLVRQELAKYRSRRHADLVLLIGGDVPVQVVTGASGTEYQIEIEILWDGERGGAIRVIGLIDDGRWPAFCPLSQEFSTAPDDAVSATW